MASAQGTLSLSHWTMDRVLLVLHILLLPSLLPVSSTVVILVGVITVVITIVITGRRAFSLLSLVSASFRTHLIFMI